MKKPTQSRGDREEIELLRQKIIELVAKKSDAAAAILSLWIKEQRHPDHLKGKKKIE